MALNVAKEELESLTDFQREIHVATVTDRDIMSRFYRPFVKSTWYASTLEKLECMPGTEEFIYKVNPSFDYLMYTYLRSVFPGASVKEEWKDRVEICLTHNVGHNIVNNAKMKHNDDILQTIDNVWLDIYYQFYQDAGAGKREAHNISVGNLKSLTEWSSHLPAKPINIDQPWFYSQYPALSFPIFQSSQDKISHIYKFRLNLSSLLRMRIKTAKGTWKHVTPIFKYLDIPSDAHMSNPELWGKYALLSKPERDMYSTCSDYKKRTLYIRDVINCDSTTPKTLNNKETISLKCQNPCLAMFWLAENDKSTSLNNLSNYTTNTFDLSKGCDPIVSTTLKYGTSEKLSDMPSDHFNLAQARKHFPSAPNEEGYHALSYAWDSTNYDGDIGVYLDKLSATLTCTLSDKPRYEIVSLQKEKEDDPDIAPAKTDNKKSSEEDTKILNLPQAPIFKEEVEEPAVFNYTLKSRLLVIKKLTFEKGEKGWMMNIR